MLHRRHMRKLGLAVLALACPGVASAIEYPEYLISSASDSQPLGMLGIMNETSDNIRFTVNKQPYTMPPQGHLGDPIRAASFKVEFWDGRTYRDVTVPGNRTAAFQRQPDGTLGLVW